MKNLNKKIRYIYWNLSRAFRLFFGLGTSEDYTIRIIEDSQHLDLKDMRDMNDYFKTLYELEVSRDAEKNTD